VETTAQIEQDLVSKRADCSSYYNMWDVRIAPDGHIGFEMAQGSNGPYLAYTSAQGGLNDGHNHRVAITRSGSTVSIKIDANAAQVYKNQPSVNLNNSAPLLFGWGACTDLDITRPFAGQLTGVDIR
jgi:hypothetical protein